MCCVDVGMDGGLMYSRQKEGWLQYILIMEGCDACTGTVVHTKCHQWQNLPCQETAYFTLVYNSSYLAVAENNTRSKMADKIVAEVSSPQPCISRAVRLLTHACFRRAYLRNRLCEKLVRPAGPR